MLSAPYRLYIYLPAEGKSKLLDVKKPVFKKRPMMPLDRAGLTHLTAANTYSPPNPGKINARAASHFSFSNVWGGHDVNGLSV